MGKRRKTTRIRPNNFDSTSHIHLSDDVHLMVLLMLAALPNLQNPFSHSLVNNCLKKLKLHLSLLIKKSPNPSFSLQQNLPNANALFSLLPVLLKTKCPDIASQSAEIIGTAALLSLDVNEIISSDSEILNSLIRALGSPTKRVSMAACNAILDLLTTSIGRQRLLEFAALEKLIMETGNTTGLGIGFMEDEHAVLVLCAVTTLINACNLQQLANIPRILSKSFLSYLKKWWANILDQMLLNDVAECSPKTHYGFSNVKTHDLAETLFRLSITLGQYTNTCRFDMVKRSIFGPTESDFEYFMLNYWEDSPFLLRQLSTVLNDHDDIFGSFVQSLNSERAVDAILCSFLQGLVSCPPIASDELDILNFLKEVKGGLGCPIIYWQDIRVLKTVEASGSTVGQIKQEVHCIKECTGSGCINSPQFINICNVKKCEEAYHDGYTIALRGMEFRSDNIAAIAEGLALLFGQPSVGANVYLTPPTSQGLARHYDDHCVFVCQLLGVKQWTVFSRSTVQLPRLYEPPCTVFSSEGESVATECKQFLLREGDILYVPRGCPHEACTIAQDGESHIDGGPAGFSLHLTLAIEVEPPFEWEGFAHVALHCWNKNQKPTSCTQFDSLLEVCNDMSIYLLHVAIKMVGDHDPTFRKACMVAALFCFPDNKGEQAVHTLDLNQRTTFSYVIDKINEESRFLEVFKTVEVAVQGKNEDFFQRMRWLQHLYQEGERENQPDWNNPLTSFNEPLLSCKSHIKEAEDTFVRVKSNFCGNVAFDDVCESFRMLLEKYRKTRNQYMNGMLALHCK